MAPPRTLLVIVTHNNARHVESCLAPFAMRTDIDVVVVDNASVDETVVLVRRACPRALLIENGRNLGFAAAVNQAARHMAGHRYLALLNPDVTAHAMALDALLEIAEAAPAAGLWGGRTVDAAGRLNPTCCLAAPSTWHAFTFGSGLSMLPWPHVFRPDSLGGWDWLGVREVPALSGALLLVAADLWRRLGGFEERFFLYGEDVDLSIRARRMGARPTFTSQASCVHPGAGSSATRGDHLVLLLAGRATLYELHAGHGGLAKAMLLAGVGLRAGLERAFRPLRYEWRAAWARRREWKSGWPGAPAPAASLAAS